MQTDAGGQQSRSEELVCGALVKDQRLLLCRRNSNSEIHPDCWFFPCGLKSVDEPRFAAAVTRIVREQLGVEIDEPWWPPDILLLRWSSPGVQIWKFTHWKGEPMNADVALHHDFKWFDLESAIESAPEGYAATIRTLILHRGVDSDPEH